MDALLSTFGIDWRVLLAQLANFGILAAALTWLLYKPVLKMVKEREQVIAKGVEDAESAARQLASAKSEAAKCVVEAEHVAEGVRKAAHGAGESERAKIIKEAEARAEAIAVDAEARAAEELARAKRESEKDIARLAMLAAEKVLLKKQ